MLSLNSLLLFSENSKELVDFYKKVFQKEPDWSGGDFQGFKLGAGAMAIGPHDKVHGKNTTPERMLFNLETGDVEGEVNRLKGLGVKVIAEPYHPGEEPKMLVATFEDLDGNYFQITSPFEVE